MRKIVFLKEENGLEQIRSRKSKRKQGAGGVCLVFYVHQWEGESHHKQKETLAFVGAPVVTHILGEGIREVICFLLPQICCSMPSCQREFAQSLTVTILMQW